MLVICSLMFFIFLQIMILSIVFSNIILNIEECDISYNQKCINDFYIKKLKVNVQIYLFKIIKVLNIKIYKNYCEIFKIKIKLNLLKKLKDDKDTSYKFIIKNIEKLKPVINKIDLELSLGTEEPMITTFSIPAISAVISVLISKYMEKYNEKNYVFNVIPNYSNTNNFSLKLTSRLKFDTLRTIFFIKKHRKIKT